MKPLRAGMGGNHRASTLGCCISTHLSLLVRYLVTAVLARCLMTFGNNPAQLHLLLDIRIFDRRQAVLPILTLLVLQKLFATLKFLRGLYVPIICVPASPKCLRRHLHICSWMSRVDLLTRNCQGFQKQTKKDSMNLNRSTR